MVQENIKLPQPTGRYNVGMSTHYLIDASRRRNDENGRPLLMQLYYPCIEIKKEYPLYLFDAMQLYKEKLARTYAPEQLVYLDKIRCRAMLNAPINPEGSTFPVLFFSHGFFMAAQLYSSLIEEMVSHGYVVVAINHTDACWPVVFPDGSSPEILREYVHIFPPKSNHV